MTYACDRCKVILKFNDLNFKKKYKLTKNVSAYIEEEIKLCDNCNQKLNEFMCYELCDSDKFWQNNKTWNDFY